MSIIIITIHCSLTNYCFICCCISVQYKESSNSSSSRNSSSDNNVNVKEYLVTLLLRLTTLLHLGYRPRQ